MPQLFERHTISFVVRLWVEAAQTGDNPQWRGQIEHVGSGKTAYFQVPTALLEFLTEHIQGLGKQGFGEGKASNQSE